MLSNNSKCNSPIEPADPAQSPPCSVTDDSSTIGDRLVSVSLILPFYAALYLIGSFFSFKNDHGYIIIISSVCTVAGLALGIIAKNKFIPPKHPTLPKVCIIVNAVCMVFVIIVSFFHFLY